MRKTGFGGKGLGEVIGMRGLLLIAALAGGAMSADAACPPAGLDLAGLEALNYVHGEGGRLMAPVFSIARRNAFAADEWSTWVAGLGAAGPHGEPVTAASLAARHNLSQFLLSLYATLRENGTPEMQARLLPGLTAALKSLG
jgi:hypothetical protein